MESRNSSVDVQGADGEGESEREGKKGGADPLAGDDDDPGVPCAVCGDPLGADDPEEREWKGSYHIPCIIRERRRALGGDAPGTETYRRRRRSRGAG